MNVTEQRRRFRGLLEGDRLAFGPPVWNPVSARVAEDLGYDWALLSGHAVEWEMTGRMDMCTATLTEYADAARRVCRATEIPIALTADFGFGNAINYMRAVEELEGAGVACIFLPSSDVPLTASGVPQFVRKDDINDVPEIPVERAVGMIEAALAARRDPALVIGVRTSLTAVARDVGEILGRIEAYVKAGVEVIWPSAGFSGEAFEAIHRAAPHVPIVGGGSTFRSGPRDRDAQADWHFRRSGLPYTDPERQRYLLDHGVRLQSIGFLPVYLSMIEGHYSTLKAIRDGETSIPELYQRKPGMRDLLIRLTRKDADNELLKRYVR